MSCSEETEAEEEDGGVNQERFLPADGVTEEASEAGREKMTENPAAG